MFWSIFRLFFFFFFWLQALSSSKEKYPIFTFVNGQGQDYGLEGHSSNHSGPAAHILPPGKLSRSNNRRSSDDFVFLWASEEDILLADACRRRARTCCLLWKERTWISWRSSWKVDVTFVLCVPRCMNTAFTSVWAETRIQHPVVGSGFVTGCRWFSEWIMAWNISSTWTVLYSFLSLT